MNKTFEPLSLAPAIDPDVVAGIHKYVYEPSAFTFAAWKKVLRPKLVGRIDQRLLEHFDSLVAETRRVRAVLRRVR
jgi:hypothetical protein